MGKTSRVKRTRYDEVTKTFQKKMLQFKKSLPMIITSVRPFFALKYLPIYLLSFGLGFYLYGPSHGFQKLMSLKTHQGRQNSSTVETLKHEIDQLKKELEARRTIQPVQVFDPGMFSRPALGQVISGFEWTTIQGAWRLHSGVDIGLTPGSNVIAAAAGTVSEVKRSDNGQFTVIIDHGNGWQSIYEDLSNPQAHTGQQVIKGVIIGTSGSAACNGKDPGFHFAIYHDGQPVNPEKLIDGLKLEPASAF